MGVLKPACYVIRTSRKNEGYKSPHRTVSLLRSRPNPSCHSHSFWRVRGSAVLATCFSGFSAMWKDSEPVPAPVQARAEYEELK